MAPVIDHIIPLSRGGHPFAIDNLQLAHRRCNAYKSSKLMREKAQSKEKKYEIPDDAFLGSQQAKDSAEKGLPWSVNWYNSAHIMNDDKE